MKKSLSLMLALVLCIGALLIPAGAADVNGNGRIDATDYLYLKRGYLGTFDLSKFA